MFNFLLLESVEAMLMRLHKWANERLDQ